jgi:hypothetical protein
VIRICTECEDEYDDASALKRQAGGLITHCPDCSEENEVKYLGVNNADGKQQGVEIIAFETQADRNAFHRRWAKNAGMHKGKSSALYTAGDTSGIKFRKVTEFCGNKNHKGRQ